MFYPRPKPPRPCHTHDEGHRAAIKPPVVPETAHGPVVHVLHAVVVHQRGRRISAAAYALLDALQIALADAPKFYMVFMAYVDAALCAVQKLWGGWHGGDLDDGFGRAFCRAPVFCQV